jgi:Tfp pilus assembly protein PilF
MKFIENIKWQTILLLSLSVILYIQTVRYGFVLDDEVVIVRNSFVQQGLQGISSIFSNDSFAGYERVGERPTLLTGGRYRPLSIALFSVIFSLFGANPVMFHLLAVSLYVIASLVLFRLMQLMLKSNPSKNLIAFVTTLLFVVHPVHTEVVSNVKSCDEQLAFIFGLGAMYSLFKWHDRGIINWAFLAGSCLFIACLAKENAITILLIGPLALWYFRKIIPGNLVTSAVPFLIAALVFILIRGSVLGWTTAGQSMHDPLNDPFLAWDGKSWISIPYMTKLATIFFIFGQYVKLMLFPFPLTHDYYPVKIELHDFSQPSVWLMLILLSGLLLLGFRSLRNKNISGFGILFFLIALSITSNFIFPVGTFMAERFLFLPSAGFCIAVTAFATQLAGKTNTTFVLPVFSIIAIPLLVLTFLRNPAWKDNETLLRTDEKYSSKSIKLQNDLGTTLLTKALQEKNATDRKVLLEEAYSHLKLAIDLHKTYYDAYLAFGACAYYLEHYKESVDAYRVATQLSPSDPKSKTGLAYALEAYGFFLGNKTYLVAGVSALEEAWQLRPDVSTAKNLANYYRELKQYSKAAEWLEKAVALEPQDAKLHYDLAKAYLAAGNEKAAKLAYEKAKLLKPDIGPL